MVPQKLVSLALAVFAMTLPLSAASAHADVFEIGPGGVVSDYQGPGIFADGTFHPLRTAARPKAPAHSAAVSALLSSAASRYALDPRLLAAVAEKESGYRPNAVSAKGAVGVMQLMERTAQDLGIDRYDLSQNILGGAAYLRQMLDRYSGNLRLALAAYNAGPAAVDRYRGVPPFQETVTYVNSIVARLGDIRPRLTTFDH
jgi:soluble lytic murein transglycosylase-like protein